MDVIVTVGTPHSAGGQGGDHDRPNFTAIIEAKRLALLSEVVPGLSRRLPPL